MELNLIWYSGRFRSQAALESFKHYELFKDSDTLVVPSRTSAFVTSETQMLIQMLYPEMLTWVKMAELR